MAKGSEQPTWKWAGDTRNCDTCGSKLRIKDVGLFYGVGDKRFIRCLNCVQERVDAFVAKTRKDMGWAA